jgi:hypothetical protein
VVQEVQDQRRVQVGQRQCRGWLAGAFLDEREEQLERIAVAFDGAGAGAALVDQAAEEEVLHQLREADLWRSHETPACGSAA